MSFAIHFGNLLVMNFIDIIMKVTPLSKAGLHDERTHLPAPIIHRFLGRSRSPDLAGTKSPIVIRLFHKYHLLDLIETLRRQAVKVDTAR